jgi:hypothetical protein
MNPFAMMEWLGRRLVMDFGFGAILEKFEQHFGQRAVKIILGLIGLAIALTCAKVIWEIALGPTVSFAAQLTKNSSLWEVGVRVFWYGIAWVAGAAVSLFIAGSLVVWKQTRQLNALLSQAEDVSIEVHATLERAEAITERAVAIVSAASKGARDQ